MIAGTEASTRRLWWAIAIGTVIQIVSFGSILVGALAAASEEDVAGGPAFALGFVLVPVVCATVAFASAHERAAMATLKGMGVWLVLGLSLGVLNPVVGLSTAFAASGAFTLRATVDRPGKARAVAVLLTAAYLLVLVLVLPQAALLAGAVTPLLGIRAADIYSERSG